MLCSLWTGVWKGRVGGHRGPLLNPLWGSWPSFKLKEKKLTKKMKPRCRKILCIGPQFSCECTYKSKSLGFYNEKKITIEGSKFKFTFFFSVRIYILLTHRVFITNNNAPKLICPFSKACSQLKCFSSHNIAIGICSIRNKKYAHLKRTSL